MNYNLSKKYAASAKQIGLLRRLGYKVDMTELWTPRVDGIFLSSFNASVLIDRKIKENQNAS